MTERLPQVTYYLTVPHVCGYLPRRQAVNVVLDPALTPDTRLYTRLAAHGFRRSGAHIYRPGCPSCSACVPLRIPVEAFRPDRIQRRVWRRNADVVVSERPAAFDEEHFALYQCYLKSRHPGGGMDNPGPEDYLSFLAARGIDTRFYDFRAGGRCLALAVVDVLDDALSAVYTFFDPEERQRSLGVYAVLWEIAAARRAAKRWLYLGYWIEGCRKMSYKDHYRPYELYINGRWRKPKPDVTRS